MTDPSDDADLQTLWQAQARGEDTISLEEIRDKAIHLERIVGRRNLREYVGAVFVVAGYGWILWAGPSGIVRGGAALVIVAALFIVYQLHRRGSAKSLPADLVSRSALEFHRVQLARQRDLLRSVWWWYLLPLLPGMLLVQIGQAMTQPEGLSRNIAVCVFTVVLAAGIYELNRRAAARLQARIDRLNGSH